MPPRKKKGDEEDSVDEKFDEQRGINGLGGRWISLKEAQEQAHGEPWWKVTSREGRFVKAVQHVKNAPPHRPVWLFENCDMYLGDWKEETKDHYPLEHGFGITYNEYPRKCKGLIYIGEWKGGRNHGKGESFWLESSRTWQTDYFPGSALTRRPGGGIPFHYCGMFQNDRKCDKQAIVRLKDGITRKGPWKDGAPVGDWISHASVAWAGTAHQNLSTSSSSSSSEEDDEWEEEVKPKRQRTARQRRQDQREREIPNPPAPSVAIKQEPIDVDEEEEEEDVDVDDDEEEEVEEEEEEEDCSTTVQAATDPGGNLPEDANKKCRLQEIQTLIYEKVIGEDPNHTEEQIKEYASTLFEAGFESVELIKSHLQIEHVESFTCMSALHKEFFGDHIEDGW